MNFKNNVKKLFHLLIISFALISAFTAKTALAVCPVCTVAVGAGVGFSRWLGIDDTISGLWIGGLLISMTITTDSWLQKKKIKFKNRLTVVGVFYYAITIIPLYFFTDIMGSANNQILGFDKLLAGIFVGSVAFIGAASFHFWLKKKNGTKVYFPFQRVIVPVVTLFLLSGVFYFITK